MYHGCRVLFFFKDTLVALRWFLFRFRAEGLGVGCYDFAASSAGFRRTPGRTKQGPMFLSKYVFPNF